MQLRTIEDCSVSSPDRQILKIGVGSLFWTPSQSVSVNRPVDKTQQPTISLQEVTFCCLRCLKMTVKTFSFLSEINFIHFGHLLFQVQSVRVGLSKQTHDSLIHLMMKVNFSKC